MVKFLNIGFDDCDKSFFDLVQRSSGLRQSDFLLLCCYLRHSWLCDRGLSVRVVSPPGVLSVLSRPNLALPSSVVGGGVGVSDVGVGVDGVGVVVNEN